jgi:hypothetical protein
MPELEIWLCPIHESLDKRGALKPLDNCVGCLRVQRDELLSQNNDLLKSIASVRDWRSPDRVLQIGDLTWFKDLKL